jgi:hypothetical protein
MTVEEMRILHQKIAEGGKVSVTEAIARHRKLGEAIAIWREYFKFCVGVKSL